MGHRNWHRNHNPVGRPRANGETERKRERERARRRRDREKRRRRASREERKRADERHRAAREESRRRDLARRDEVYGAYGSEAWGPCLNKAYFHDRGYAEWYARGSSEWYGVDAYAYKCQYCDGWHLTTHPREGQAVEAV